MLQKICKPLFYKHILKFDQTKTIKSNVIAIASVAQSDPIMKITHQISYTELFNPEFISAETDFADIQELLDFGQIEANTAEEFSRVPTSHFDNLAQRTTRFQTWREFQLAAVASWLKRTPQS